MDTRRLTRLALFTTVALIIFTVEAQIPVPIPLPGVKLGLANVVTVYAAFTMTGVDAVLILLGRILLGSLFTGNMMALLYSLGGGALCILVTLALAKILRRNQMWIASVAGAIAHNIGQLTVAAAVMQTRAVFAYLPALLISGVITGAFTGLAVQLLTDRLSKQ
jgi:heptaprenyl diphosphate synthase